MAPDSNWFWRNEEFIEIYPDVVGKKCRQLLPNASCISSAPKQTTVTLVCCTCYKIITNKFNEPITVTAK